MAAISSKVSAVVEAAKKFVSEAKAGGWSVYASAASVTITKSFTPGDKLAYSDADSDAYGILGLAPLKGGSVWGTDGGSVGGAVGLDGGYYRLSKSGTGKRFLAVVAKLTK